MTDIIKRLRAEREQAVAVQRNASVALDAARDEIERLRAELARIRGLPRLSALDDEIERLRALLRAIMDDTSDGQESMSDDIRDRIERALEPKP